MATARGAAVGVGAMLLVGSGADVGLGAGLAAGPVCRAEQLGAISAAVASAMLRAARQRAVVTASHWRR
jgi:hypothetical protein